MADEADMAFDIASEHVARGLAAIAAKIPAGVAGECDECGENMPRLVGGRCGFCRDGRRPPLSFFDADRVPPAPSVAPAPAAKEQAPMTLPVSALASRKIEFTGAILAAIEQRAEVHDIPFKQAAAELIELAVNPSEPATDAVEAPAAAADTAPTLSEIPLSELLTEIERRCINTQDHDDAIARAIDAEAKLATLRAVLA